MFRWGLPLLAGISVVLVLGALAVLKRQVWGWFTLVLGYTFLLILNGKMMSQLFVLNFDHPRAPEIAAD